METRSVFVLTAAIVALAWAVWSQAQPQITAWWLVRAAARGDVATVELLAERMMDRTDQPGRRDWWRRLGSGFGQGEVQPQEVMDQAFLAAAAAGQPDTAVALLRAGANPAGADAEGRNALWWAVESGNPDLAEELAARGVPWTSPPESEVFLDAAFVAAAAGGDGVAIDLHLAFRGNAAAGRTSRGRLPLVEAIRCGQEDVTRRLVAAGAGVRQRDGIGRDAAGTAAAAGREAWLEPSAPPPDDAAAAPAPSP